MPSKTPNKTPDKATDSIASELAKISKEVNAHFGIDVMVPGNDLNLSDVKIYVPTASHILNLLLGGGIPVGRIMEVRVCP
jgi:RecA/RadA recombinase